MRGGDAPDRGAEAYREILDSLGDIVYEIDAEGVLTYVSPVVEQILGFKPGDLVGHSFRGFLHSADRERALEAFADLRGGEIGPREYRFRHRDGSYRWVRTSSRPLFDDEHFLGIRGVVSDITELRESHERLRLLAHAVRSIGEGVCLTDADDVIHFVNEPFARIFGYAVDELVGQPVQILRPPGFPEELAAEIGARTAADGFRGDVPNLRKDGSKVLVSLSTSLVTDEDGAMVGQIGVVRDVTEQRRAEEARRASDARYRALFEASSDGVMLLEGGRFLEVNGAAAEMFALPREELIDATPWDVSPERQPDGRQSREKGEELIVAALAGEPQRFRWRHRRADGAALDVEVSLNRVEIGGLVLVQSLVRDVSGQVRAEALESKRLRQLGAVSRVARRIASTLDAEAVQRAAVDEIRSSFGFHNVSLLLLDAESGSLGRQAMSGAYAADASPDYVQRTGEGLIGAAAASGETVLVNDVAADSRYLGGFGWEVETRAEIAVPIKLADAVLGVLDVQETVVDAFDEIDAQTLQTLADQIALSLHNARLYQRLEAELEERRRAQTALRESEGRFRLLYENAPAPYQSLGPDGEVLEVNPAWLEWLGYEREEVLGRNIVDFLAPHDLDKFRERFPRFKREGSVNAVFELVKKDGTHVVASVRGRVSRDADGAFVKTHCVLDDITERERAERALRESEARYRDLVETASDLICTHDLEGNVLSVNETAVRRLGYDVDEVVGRNLRSFLVPAVRPEFDHYLEVIADKGSARGLMNLLTRDGEKRFWEYSNTLRTQGVDEPVVRGFARDVTDRIVAERALRASEERYRLLAETAHDMIVLISPDGTIEYCNQRALDISGYDREEVSSVQLDQLIAPEYLDEWKERWKRRLEGAEEQFLYEVEFVTRDGRRVPAEISSQPIIQEGDLAGILVVARDITERRHAEEAVRAERDRVKQYLDIAPVLFIALDEAGVVTMVNQRTSEVLGRSEDEIVGRDWFDGYVPPSFRGGVRTAFAQLLAGDLEPFEYFEAPIVTASGEERMVAWRNSLVRDHAGAISGTLSAGEDITERRQLEEQLRHAQKMEAMGRLAGGVAHDFNNLLQAMLATVQLLRLGGADEERVAETTAELEQHVRRGASLARQLLLFAKRGVTQPERLDLDELVTSAVGLLRRLVRENVRVSAVACGHPLPVDGDRGQLEQVLTNLALNAVDAMPDGGELTLRTGLWADGEVWLEVADSGHGMDEAVLGKIFEPFFTTKEAGKGTGLGLAVVHGIIAQHQGRIEVESQPGRGSTFRIVLPRHDSGVFASVTSEAAASREPARGAGERILLVEDNEQIRTVFSRMLERLGYQVVAVDSGEAAGALPAAPAFDLLISDVMLPGASGVEVARGLVERWPDLRVILMSGYAEDDVLREEILAGQVHFLQKPVDLPTLSQHVRSTLDD